MGFNWRRREAGGSMEGHASRSPTAPTPLPLAHSPAHPILIASYAPPSSPARPLTACSRKVLMRLRNATFWLLWASWSMRPWMPRRSSSFSEISACRGARRGARKVEPAEGWLQRMGSGRTPLYTTNTPQGPPPFLKHTYMHGPEGSPSTPNLTQHTHAFSP